MNAIWLALALLAPDGGGLRFAGSVAAGGGYDGNLLVAPGVGAAGSSVASVSATGGAAIEPSSSLFLYFGAAVDGERFGTLGELDRTSAGAEAIGVVDLADPLALVLGTSGSWNWYADPARSGASLSARASLRYRPLSWLATRAGYAHTWRDASDPVYATSFGRLFAELEFRPWSRTWLTVGGFAERGDGTFYQEVVATSAEVPTSTFVPYRAPATVLGAGVGIEQGLGAGIALEAGVGLRRVDAPDGVSTGPAVNAAVVWRFD